MSRTAWMAFPVRLMIHTVLPAANWSGDVSPLSSVTFKDQSRFTGWESHTRALCRGTAPLSIDPD
jgi:hypothetical protein